VFNHQIELSRYSRMVSLEEIATNDYNLNIPRYIDSSEPEDIHNLSAHLNLCFINIFLNNPESFVNQGFWE